MAFTVGASPNHSQTSTVNMRCPICSHNGAFHGISNVHDVAWSQAASPGGKGNQSYQAGARKCPNVQCHALVFVVLSGGQIVTSFPPELIDFDSSNLPDALRATLEEAIRCHAAECYRATAFLVRRLLEELCREKGAGGNNLKDKISALGGTVLVPKELLDAADELRLLGNDAAHVEAKTYDKVDRDESSLAIDLAKELLKAVYQYGALVDRLRALKKS